MKLKNGKRNYYEGRLILKNSDSKDYQLFRVFTDIDLGIIPKVQNTIQEAVV